ncbi:MAG: hypothetical protein ABSD73_05445 [Candidatus Bathyarchaeia archaeon]
MKSGKTHRTEKSRKRLLRKRVSYVFAAMVALILVGVLAYTFLSPRSPTINDSTPKIAIVDQLSAQWPDPEFNQTVQGILNQTGLKVDYYPSQDVTVDFYRNLPSQNYKLIIFRVHSTAETGAKDMPPWVVFFTSENYSGTAHVSEQSDMRVVYVKFPDVAQLYFGITPTFVENSTEGKFNDTTIIAMGCDGLNKTSMAEAFIEKGAKAYISWNGFVSADHTDEATECLLRHLVTENQTVEEAVKETMNEVGPDPTDKSVLMFYPDNAGPSFLLLSAATAAPTVMATPAVSAPGLVNATVATPTVRTARKNTNQKD